MKCKTSAACGLALALGALALAPPRAEAAVTFTNYQLDMGAAVTQNGAVPLNWTAGYVTTDKDGWLGDQNAPAAETWIERMWTDGLDPGISGIWDAYPEDGILLVSRYLTQQYESVKQTISGLTVGKSYTWSFVAAQNSIEHVRYPGISTTMARLEVTFSDGTNPDTVVGYNINRATAAQRYDFTFTATSSTMEVELFTGNGHGLYEIDGYNAQLQVLSGSGLFTPEPSSALLSGLAALGLLARRRRG